MHSPNKLRLKTKEQAFCTQVYGSSGCSWRTSQTQENLCECVQVGIDRWLEVLVRGTGISVPSPLHSEDLNAPRCQPLQDGVSVWHCEPVTDDSLTCQTFPDLQAVQENGIWSDSETDSGSLVSATRLHLVPDELTGGPSVEGFGSKSMTATWVFYKYTFCCPKMDEPWWIFVGGKEIFRRAEQG
jgi:hypothetical protein